MIILNKEQIEALIEPNEIMDTIEEAYRIFGANEFFMPPRPVVEHENKTMIYMPCYTKDVIGTKILSSFPDNAKLGLPTLDGVVLLNDYTTGAPTALLDGIGASIRISLAAKAILISFCKLLILDTLTPKSGLISNLVTLGPI